MKSLRNQLKLLLGLGLISLLAACGGASVPEPIAITINADPETAEVDTDVTLTATISGDGAESDNISWAATGGTFSVDSGAESIWTAPSTAGNYTVTATLSAGAETEAASVDIEVIAADGISILGSDTAVYRDQIQLTTSVTGEAAEAGNIIWTATGGTLSTDTGDQTTWTAPTANDTFEITAQVDGLPAISATHEVLVVFPCDSGDPAERTDPCSISTLTQLQHLDDYRDGHFVLGSDINASATSEWNDGQGFQPIGRSQADGFTGTLDGDNFEIAGLNINRPDAGWVGLFGALGEDAAVSNLNLTDVDIQGGIIIREGPDNDTSDTGAIAGVNEGLVTNSTVSGTVTGPEISGNQGPAQTGGLVGRNLGGVIEESTNHSTVSGHEEVGGITGRNTGFAEIRNSQNTGSISGRSDVGGIAGRQFYSSIINSHSTGSVTGTHYNTGGLVGHNQVGSEITNGSSSSGAVSGRFETGGLVGLNHGVIEDSHSLSNVTASGSRSGGLVGSNGNWDLREGTISHSYSDNPLVHNTEDGGTSNSGGLVGINYGTIADSYSASSLVSTAPTTGGLVGYNQTDGVIKRSYTTSSVTASGTHSVGGLVGENWGSIEQSYSLATEAAASGNRAAGLVAYNRDSGSIVESYSMTRVVSNENPGGLIGVDESGGDVERSFWDTQTATIPTSAGGLGAIAVTDTSLMLHAGTFEHHDWDFTNDWQIETGNSPPELQPQPR